MSINLLRDLLDRQQIKYTIITHSVAYTAQGIAALTHIPGQELAKTVIVNIDGELAMAVLPASCQVDLTALQMATGANAVALAAERDFMHRFPGCETGAMPPFGNLYGMKVYVDERLIDDEEIAFNAGSHRELMRLAYEDFDRMVQPKVLQFALGRVRAA